MPPKSTPKGQATEAKTKKTPQSAGRGRGRGRGRGKKPMDEEEEDFDDEEEEMMMMAKAKQGKKKTPKKAGSEDEEDEEDLGEDDEERFDDDEDEEDDEDFDEDEDEDEESDDDEPRPKKTLFIKNLPTTTTEEEVKALSPDIQEVRLEATKNPNAKTKFAVINFADEETAAKNLEVLKEKKVQGVDLVVDFVGTQSIVTFVTPALTPSSDPLKLYCTGFGREITIDQLKAMFPTCDDVTLPLNPKDGNKPIGYAFIHYSDEDVCRKAHDECQELMYENRTLVVMYGKKAGATTNTAPPAKRQAPKGKPGRKPKKAKQESEEEEEDEPEDEDEEGEENGGDGDA